MAKNSLLDYSNIPDSNTDIGGINIQGTAPVNNFDNAIRTLMAQMRQDLDYKQVFATKTANYTAVLNDNNAFIKFSAAYTLSLTAAATLGLNWHITVSAENGAITVDPNSSELINGVATLTIPQGAIATIVCDGTQFFASLNDKTSLVSKSANYTALAGDDGATLRFTAAATLSLTAAATLGANWRLTVRAEGADVTIDPNGSELINGASTLTVLDGSTVDVICSGSAFYASVSFQTATAINKFSGGWEPIGKLSMTGQTSLAVTDLSAYSMIRCTYNHIVTAQSVLIQFSTNNGSSWLTSTADYFYIFTQTAWNGTTSSVGGDANTIAGLSLGEEVSGGVMNIVSFNKARVCQSNSTQSIDTTSLRISRNISQRTIGTTARNALRIISSAGGGINGEFQFEGIRG